MACIHNQAEISKISAEINAKQSQINSLKSNITKCNDIKSKHIDFSDKLQCVIDNLEGNTVVAGKAYDDGKMELRQAEAKQTIVDCENMISESEKQVTLLENEIKILEQRMAALNGNCELCSKL